MFNKAMINQLVKETINDTDNDGNSKTCDSVVLGFIDYMVNVLHEGSGLYIIDAIDYLKSDEMRESFEYYVDEYASMVIKPKYSPNDVMDL